MRIDLPNDRSANVWLDEGRDVARVGVTRLGRRFMGDAYVVTYAWQVLDTSYRLVEGGADLHPGEHDSPPAMLATLLQMLRECGETYGAPDATLAEPESLTRFPENVRPWCWRMLNELTVAAVQLEEWRNS